MLAVNDVFYASAMIFLLLIPVVWLSRPKVAGAGAGAAAMVPRAWVAGRGR